MDNFSSILGFVLLLLMLLAMTLFVLVRTWRLYVLQNLAEVRNRLRSLQSDSARIRRESARFSVDDPEPFGTLFQSLSEQLVRVDSSLQDAYQEYGELYRQVKLSEKVDWKGALSFPYDWWARRSMVDDLQISVDQSETWIAESRKLADRLIDYGKVIAAQSQQILSYIKEALHILGELREHGLEGDTFDGAVQAARNWEATLLGQIPVIFFSKEALSASVDLEKEQISRVYRLLTSAAPTIQKLLNRVDDWRTEYANLAQNLQSIPVSIESLEERMQVQAHAPILPIQWEKSKDELQMARMRLETVGLADKSRIIEDLFDDVDVLDALAKRLGEAEKHYQLVCVQYDELQKLVTSEEIVQGNGWLRSSFSLMLSVNQYDPENWPRSLAVSGLKRQIEALAALHSRLLPDQEHPKVVREGELAQHLEGIRRLHAGYVKSRPAVAKVKAILDEMRSIEQSIRDPLIRANSLYGQLESIVVANPLLNKLAGKEPERLRLATQNLLVELDHPEKITVDKKARKAGALLTKIEHNLSSWLETINHDLDIKRDDLEESLALLNEAVSLDDPVLNEVNRLVQKTTDVMLDDGVQAIQVTFPLADHVQRLRSANDAWQRCVSAQVAVDDIAGPTLERYRKAEKQRTRALEIIGRVKDLVPEGLQWPPTTQRLGNEIHQFEMLEKRWQGIKRDRVRALQLVSSLSDLTEEYSALADQLGRIAERALLESDRVQELEKRLEEARKLWLHQVHTHKGQHMLIDSIESLLAETDRDLETLKKGYEHGGLPYAQVLQGLRSICRKVEDALVPTDGNQVMEINGILQRRL